MKAQVVWLLSEWTNEETEQIRSAHPTLEAAQLEAVRLMHERRCDDPPLEWFEADKPPYSLTYVAPDLAMHEARWGEYLWWALPIPVMAP